VVITHASTDAHWATPTEVDPAAGRPGSHQFHPSRQLRLVHLAGAAGLPRTRTGDLHARLPPTHKSGNMPNRQPFGGELARQLDLAIAHFP